MIAEAAIGPAGIDAVEFVIDDWQRLYAVGDHGYAVADAHVLISGPAIALRANGTWTFVISRPGTDWKIVSWTWGGPPSAFVTP